MSKTLVGQTMLVTGASSGIGRAIAMEAARAGADVALTYHRNQDGAAEVERGIHDLGRRVAVFQLDVADGDAISRVASETRDLFGRIDVWVNNAGADVLTGPGATLDPMERLDRLIAVDLRGTIAASWCAAELMQQQTSGGTIINMSWDHVVSGMPGRNPQLFAAIKGGVLAFSKALARSVAPRVRVNVLAPGWIGTSFGQQLDEPTRSAIAESVPLKRWGTPDDVAGAAIFLASPAAAYLTGQTLFVGGGAVM